MLYNDLELVRALHRATKFKRIQCRTLWLTYETGEVCTPLIVAAGIVSNTVKASHALTFGVKHKPVVRTGRTIPANSSRPYYVYRLTSDMQRLMKTVHTEVLHQRYKTLLRLRNTIDRTL